MHASDTTKLGRAIAWTWERLVVALVSALMAALTLLAWSLLLLALLGTPSDDLGIAHFLGAHVFSRGGVAIIALAALAAFCAGGDRMAVVFSALWGTHPAWLRFGAYLREKAELLNAGYRVPAPMLLGVLVLVAVLTWLYLA